MNTKIQGKASLSDSVRRVHYDEAVTALGAAIDDKATADSMRLCAERMKVRIDCCSCLFFMPAIQFAFSVPTPLPFVLLCFE